MGVRGKIEAVIYAAEEPVTLAQLTALFGPEALAEQRAPGGSAHEPVEGAEPDAAAFASAVAQPYDGQQTLEQPTDTATEPLAQAEGQPQTASGDVLPEPFHATGEPTLFGDPDADKRAARLRDRQAREAVRDLLHELMFEYEQSDRGMEIREIAGGYRVATKPEYHDAVRAFARSLKPPMKLTLPALETLAVIAYKQPVTAPEVAEIRGVDSGGVLGSLITRKLVTTAGRKQVIGRPILYKTTKEFLLRFGLKDLSELPSVEEFEKMAEELENLAPQEVETRSPAVPIRVDPSVAGHAEEVVTADLGPDDNAPEPMGATRHDHDRAKVTALEAEERQGGKFVEEQPPREKA